MTQSYVAKPADYFRNARKEIKPLLPETMRNVLEIGCGSGATLGWLKQSGFCEEAHGIELFEAAAISARQYADSVLAGDAEQIVDAAFEGTQFDLILCLDVLEHMVDPWAFVPKLHRLLAPTGRLVVSLPNVRNVKVLLPLLFKGRWRYEDAGILDRTHLRFFTLEGAKELLTTQQFQVKQMVRRMPSPTSKQGLLNRAMFGLLSDFLTSQYLIACGHKS